MKFMILLLGIILLSFNLAVSQCPPSTTCTATWTQKTINHSLSDKNTITITGYISHRVNCDGVMEFVVDSTFLHGNSEYLESFQYEEYGVNTARDLMWLHILEYPHDFGYNPVPLCSSDTFKMAHVYTASCGVWVKCSYKVDPASQMCDIGYIPPTPLYSDGTDFWVDSWKWQNCGNACCRKEYQICITYDLTINRYIFKVKEVKKEKILDCEKEGEFFDWKTQSPIPCHDDC